MGLGPPIPEAGIPSRLARDVTTPAQAVHWQSNHKLERYEDEQINTHAASKEHGSERGLLLRDAGF